MSYLVYLKQIESKLSFTQDFNRYMAISPFCVLVSHLHLSKIGNLSIVPDKQNKGHFLYSK